MKKIFIGCGILVVLLLGALGYLAYKVAPHVKDSVARFERFGTEITVLEESFPFEQTPGELDTQRFASALDLRVDLKARFQQMEGDFDEYGEQLEEEDTGFFDMLDVLAGAMGRFYPLLDDVPSLLREAHMGPSEYTHHCRVLWAALQQVDAGAGGVALEPLEGEFDRFRGAYGQMRKQDEDEWPPLSELLGEFDPQVLEQARAMLAVDTDRVLAGMVDTEFEAIYMKFGEYMRNASPAGEVDVSVTGDTDDDTGGDAGGDAEEKPPAEDP
jgi:hypothetical protein